MKTLVLIVALATGACTVPYAGGARPIQPAQVAGADWVRAAPTPVVRQQHAEDCGLAALAMVAGSWNRAWSVEELNRDLPPGKHGVNLVALRDLARAKGLDAFAIAATPADLERELAHGRPVIVGLVLPHDRNYNRSHYEVAIAYNPKDGTLVTLDPATGDWMRRSRKVLDVEWKPAAYAALVVTGDKPAVAER